MKTTPLTHQHIKSGAKMMEFAGYNMPVVYTGINEEHQAVRNSVGVFDVSHMGEFILKGEYALDLLQKVTTNDVSKLSPGQAQYSCLPNDKGGIVDDLLVYHLEDNNYMLVVNASNIEKDWNWIQQQDEWDVEMYNISAKTSLFAVQGPNAAKAIQLLTNIKLEELDYYTFTKGNFAGFDNILVSATGYTGSGGFEIYVENEHAEAVWEAILSAGKNLGIRPVGLAARDTLRLEMGFCLYGNDIDDTTSPIEAGLGWITKFTKDFISKDLFQKQKEEGVQRKLVGFEMLERGIPRQGYDIFDENDNKVGNVTSGTQSPSLGKAIGLGYVKKEFSKTGTNIYIGVRNKKLKAEVVRPPFYKPNK